MRLNFRKEWGALGGPIRTPGANRGGFAPSPRPYATEINQVYKAKLTIPYRFNKILAFIFFINAQMT